MADAGLTWEDLRVIPKEEVAKHNTIADFWLVLHGIVYDVPAEEIKNHPGGEEVITVYAGGKDGGEDFMYADHEKGTLTDMEKYRVGVLEGFEHRKNTKLSSINEKFLQDEKRISEGGASLTDEPETSEEGGQLKKLVLPAIFIFLSLAAFVIRKR
jgi:hypothetical protein